MRSELFSNALSNVTKNSKFIKKDSIEVYLHFHVKTGKSLGKGRVQLGALGLKDVLRSQKAKGVLIHRDDWISITPEIQLLFTEF